MHIKFKIVCPNKPGIKHKTMSNERPVKPTPIITPSHHLYFNAASVCKGAMNCYNKIISTHKIYDICIFKPDSRLKNSTEFLHDIVSYNL